MWDKFILDLRQTGILGHCAFERRYENYDFERFSMVQKNFWIYLRVPDEQREIYSQHVIGKTLQKCVTPDVMAFFTCDLNLTVFS